MNRISFLSLNVIYTHALVFLWVCIMQVSLPSQLERDCIVGSSADTATVSSSMSLTFGQSQKFSTPPVHRDIQRITAPTNAARHGMQPQELLIAVVG